MLTLEPAKRQQKIQNRQVNICQHSQPSLSKSLTHLAQPASQTTIPKPQNSPTQAEIAAANQKKETEQAVQQLKISVRTKHEKILSDLAKKPAAINVSLSLVLILSYYC